MQIYGTTMTGNTGEVKMCKEKRSYCHIINEEAILVHHERQRKSTVNHDPRMLVQVLNMNAGIHTFESFNVAFVNMIQNEALLSDDMLEIEE